MGVDLQRRAFFRSGSVKKISKDVHLPWRKSDEHFLEACTQCGKCVDACPEAIIGKGDGGYPTVDFDKGECTYCKACVEACPEPLFDLNKTTVWELNIAIEASCFAKRDIVCQSCSDACEPQAIKFDFRRERIPKPDISLADCTLCGACVSSCPANAIAITPVDRTTHEEIAKRTVNG